VTPRHQTKTQEVIVWYPADPGSLLEIKFTAHDPEENQIKKKGFL
jgi:hypothetical protein